jgi:allantoicase
VLFATDEWFAVCENLLQHTTPTFDPNAFCSQGKVMDGWESRRRRLAGHDWCVIQLAYPGRIVGVEVDTAWFTGNQTPKISLLAAEVVADDDSWMPGARERGSAGGGQRGTCRKPVEIEAADASMTTAATWHTLLPVTSLRPGFPGSSVHYFTAGAAFSLERTTHLRLNCFPDGGVARLRVYGYVKSPLTTGPDAPSADLAALENGGRGLGESNAHYGRASNMLQPSRGIDMGDGWETARHPDRPEVLVIDPATGISNATASDWAVVRLGAVCAGVEQLVIDTNHFRGNYPESVEVHACFAPTAQISEVCCEPSASPAPWRNLLPRTRVDPSRQHIFLPMGASDDELAAAATSSDDPQPRCEQGLADIGHVTHLRLTIFPDGGVMRLRVIGKPSAELPD